MLDFGALPPEVNSSNMFSGPGSGSLMAAASAWNQLAAELNSAALSYDKVITTLSSDEWMGPASASMAQAAEPYVAWMTSTTAKAEQAAAQARAAAAAYETALAATVPVPLVAANRAELAQLVSTNVLGQNTGAIAANEAQYGEMWAQDATAMYGYAGQSAAATKVTPFTAAPQVASPTAQATQATATTSATATSAGTAQSTLSQLVSSLPSQLQSLASPAATTSATTSYPILTELWYLFSGQSTLPTNLNAVITGYNSYSSLWYNTEGLPYFSVGMANFGVQIAKSTGMLGGAGPAAAGEAAPAAGLGGLGGTLGGGGGMWAAARRSLPGWAMRPHSASCRCRHPGQEPPRRQATRRSRSRVSPPLHRRPGDPETCWAACRWPAARASARATPGLDTGSAPPSWPDHPSPDNESGWRRGVIDPM